jgi:hypothetical protein
VFKVSSKAAAEAGGELRWLEEEELKGCVHLHDGRLGKGIVIGVREYAKVDGKSWLQSLKETEQDNPWLVDN